MPLDPFVLCVLFVRPRKVFCSLGVCEGMSCPGIDRPLTVLALGMLADIVAPLLCVPEVDLIFVIDRVDASFLQPWYTPCGVEKTFQYVQGFIRHIIEEGSDLKLQCEPCLLKKTSKEWPNVIKSLPRKGKIVNDELHAEQKRWVLDFQYGARVVRLVYYFERDYVRDPWPPEVRHVDWLLTIGSPFPVHTHRGALEPLLRERCSAKCHVVTSSVVYEDLTEGWFVPQAERVKDVFFHRGSDRVNCFCFPLASYLDNQKLAARCFHCGKDGVTSRCSRCHSAKYCSRECQQKAWPLHKGFCKG